MLHTFFRPALLAVSTLLVMASRGQYTVDWSEAAADINKQGELAARDSADNVIVTGYRPSYLGNGHIYTRKYDKYGVLQWEAVDMTGATWKFERPTAIAVTDAQEIVVVGHEYTGTSNTFPDTAVVIKYGPQGNLLWRTELGHGYSYGVRGALDASGNVYVGMIGVQPPGFTLAKVDGSGNVLFDLSDATYGGTSLSAMRVRDDRVVMVAGGPGVAHGALSVWDTTGVFLWGADIAGYGAQDVELDEAGNTYVLTSFPDQVAQGTAADLVVRKYDAAGDSIAQFSFDFNGADGATRMVYRDGRLTTIGWNIQSGSGYMDWITARIDTAGGLVWSARYNATSTNDERPSWLAVRDNGEVFVTGQGGPSNGMFLSYVTVKYDAAGAQAWAHTDPYYGGRGMCCVLGKDSAVYVAGLSAMTVTRYVDQLITSAQLQAGEEPHFGLFPNPTSGVVRLSVPSKLRVDRLEVLDQGGRTVKIQPGVLPVEGTLIDLSGLSHGAYMVRVVHPSGAVVLPVVVE
ncbi:MAG: hypothetical protein JNL05_00695 [Flavobacteriales bacterium]|nr:hypothetical protein [Flavobacteriales bacterium]